MRRIALAWIVVALGCEGADPSISDLGLAEAADTRRRELSEQRRGLVEADAQAAAERELVAADAVARRQEIAVADRELAQTRRRVDAARGEHDSVASRLAAARRRRGHGAPPQGAPRGGALRLYPLIFWACSY